MKLSITKELLTYSHSKGRHQKKNTELFGNFSQISGPPPPTPPFWEPLVQKKIYGLFCVLGPKEHFWFLQKCSLFVSILTYTFGNRGPPPPSRKKFPNNPVFADFFPELTDQDPKSNYLKVIKLIRYHLPPIVKHVLAPQNDFGMPKITWSNHKSFGIEETPLCWEKFPNNPVFFLSSYLSRNIVGLANLEIGTS